MPAPSDAKITPLDQLDGTEQHPKATNGGCVEYFKNKIKSYDYADVLLDPYVKITAVPSLETKQTADLQDVEEKATWNENLDFKYGGAKQGQLYVEVWDYDVGVDDLIGTATVELMDVFKDPGNFVNFKLDLSDPDLNDCGELHLKVQLTPDDASAVQVDRAKGQEITKLKEQKEKASEGDTVDSQLIATLNTKIRAQEETLGLYSGKLVVQVLDGYRLKNYEKEVGRVEDDKRLHVAAAVFIIAYLLIAIVAYKNLEPESPSHPGEAWTAIDCVYFAVCTLTTVGYGDLYPQTRQGKIFTCFYVYIGIGVVSACAGYLISVMLESKTSGVAEMMAQQSDATKLREEKNRAMRKRLLKSLLMVFSFTMLGTIMYSQVFDIGSSKDDATQAVVDAFYMSCITMTSVGYGDFYPNTQDGRLFGIFWIFCGAVLVASAGGDLLDSVLDFKQDEINRKIIARNLKTRDLLAIDDDDSGEIDELEYIGHMLVKLRKCEAEDIQELRDRFAELDKSGDGTLAAEDFAAAGI